LAKETLSIYLRHLDLVVNYIAMDKCLIVMQQDAEVQYCKLYIDAISTERAVEFTVYLGYVMYVNVIVFFLCLFKRRLVKYISYIAPNSEGSDNP
jgi:hypothetical protein